MSQSRDAAVHDLAVRSLHEAIRRAAALILEAQGPATVADYRRVEWLMRIAVALAGGRPPHVQVHNLPAEGTGEALPGLLSVGLTDLLVARAADHLPAALRGEAGALGVLGDEAGRLIEVEDIQLG